MTKREIAEEVGISTKQLLNILREYLEIRDLSTSWVPPLPCRQKHSRFVTLEETRIYCNAPDN